MTFDWNEWGQPLGVIALAALGGGFAAFWLKRDDGQADAISERGRLEDLARRQDDAVEALASLETQRAQMAPEDYQAERRALLDKGANAMRKLDEANHGAPAEPIRSSNDALAIGIGELTAALKRGDLDEVTYAKAVAALASAAPARSTGPAPTARPISQSATAPAPAAPPALSPVWQGAIYALAGAGLIGGLLWYAANQAEPRREGASMTGNQELGTMDSKGDAIVPDGQEPPIFKERRAAAEAAVAANPNDVQALNELTQLSFNDPSKAWSYNEAARKADPKDNAARMYHGVISAMMGMPDKAEERFAELLAEVPDYGPAWAWRGLVQLEAKQYEQAEASLLRAKELGISDHTLENSLKMAQNKGVMPDAGPAPEGSTPPPPAGNTATIAAGTIDIDPNRATFKGKTLFVSVKDPSKPGPPLAAVQLPPGPFPMPFAITDANRMAMGATGPMPDQVVLTLRLDDDGNAFTKNDTDPQVSVESLARGTSGLNLTLK